VDHHAAGLGGNKNGSGIGEITYLKAK